MFPPRSPLTSWRRPPERRPTVGDADRWIDRDGGRRDPEPLAQVVERPLWAMRPGMQRDTATACRETAISMELNEYQRRANLTDQRADESPPESLALPLIGIAS